MSKCLGCYDELDANIATNGYHSSCSQKLFGTDLPPIFDFSLDELEALARKALTHHLGITGVQPKVSVDLKKHEQDPKHRLMIVGLWGSHILKPPTKRFPDMPVVEDATMHMAKKFGIETALHGLLRTKSNELAYITRRFDRKKDRKLALEDFCQLSGLLTESKYKTSMEKAGKIILTYSSNPGLDAVNFFDISLFSFLTGNADMHLKNFSLITKEDGEVSLSPAYDLLSTKLMPVEDREEMALTINGKKAKLTKKDFESLADSLKIPKKSAENSILRLKKALPEMLRILQSSFLSEDLQAQYLALIDARGKILFA